MSAHPRDGQAALADSVMRRLRLKRLRFDSRARRRLFLARETLVSRLGPRRSLTVLFSPHPRFDPVIRTALARTPYRAAFEELAVERIAAYDVVVPLSVPAIEFLQEHRGDIPRPRLPIPGSESVRLCDDKLRFNQALQDAGFGGLVPAAATGFPYVLKKRVDGWGQNCHVVRDARREAELAPLLDDPGYYRQAFVPGEREFATHLLVEDGRIRYALNIEYTFGHPFPVKGRDQPATLRICGCPHLGLFAAILRHIGFEGLCCVNYKPAGRTPMLLEINPRFGGSLAPYCACLLRRLA
jgi:hypothetical protein